MPHIVGLWGDFAAMPLTDLTLYLANRRASGILQLQQEQIIKQFIVVDGAVVQASSNQVREYLGQFLINMGQLNEEQLEKAFRTQKETSILLGRILVMTDMVSAEAVKSALMLKVRETLLDAFSWASGQFRFELTTPTQPPDSVEIQLDLQELHREGEFRETAWQAIRAVFPHGNLRLELDAANLPEEMPPGSVDERLIECIREGQTIDEMILSLHATDFFLYQKLYALYRLEAVRIVVSDETPDEPLELEVLGEELSEGEYEEEIEKLLENGLSLRAEALARKGSELYPTLRMMGLLQIAEEKLLSELRIQLTQNGQVPQLFISAAELKKMSLSAPERYLLSRVDGQRPLSSIISVSPLQELEALKLFRRFIDEQWIGIRIL